MKRRETILANIAVGLGRMYEHGGDEVSADALAEIISHFPVLDEALELRDDALNRIESNDLPSSHTKVAIQ